jgi:hypothetical protein
MSSEQQNLEIVRRGYELFGKGDVAGLLALFDPDIEWTTPGPADLPTAGTRRGAQAVGAFFQTLASTYDFTRFDPQEFIAQGDRVLVRGIDTFVVKATGKTLDFKWVHAFTVKNGKVTSFEEFGDVSAVVDELRKAQARV